MATERLILLEFNELSHHLLDSWMTAGKLPHFKRFYESSEVFITDSDEKSPPYMEPWIQWYSIHTGLSYRQHGVFHLTDGPKANHKDIWQVLMAKGFKVGNCSSMNCKGFQSAGSFFLPDPWCTTERAHPPELNTFYKVVATKVQEYSNRKDSLTKGDYLRFGRFLLAHGLSVKSVTAILNQMLDEWALKKDTSWRRVVLLDKLQLDVFRHYWHSLKPQFATFFLNSTAHYQHAYWRHMRPEDFAVRPGQAEITKYGEAICFGYQQMDRVLADLFEFEQQGALLVLATALGQQAYLKKEAIGGQHFYRPRDAEKLLEDLDIVADRLLPVMTHQYVAHFGDVKRAEAARCKLQTVTYNGRPVFRFGEAEPGSIYFDNEVQSHVPNEAVLDFGDGRKVGFYDVFYRIDGVKSGCHHPEGILWLKTGRHKVHRGRVSILDIYPTILTYLGMSEAIDARIHQGKSLV